MTETLIHDCEVVVTMDDAGREIAGGSILLEGGRIVWVGAGEPPGDTRRARRVDGRGTVALPGLVNTHHHLYQTLTRVRATDQELFGWLKALYPVWADVDEEWVYVAARVGLAELALSGCSLTTDHHYIFPPGQTGLLEAQIRAAAEIGLRFHPCRGSMDLGTTRGGLPPDEITQDLETILAETEEAVRRHHDPSPGAMVRVAVAPCSPFSVTAELMRASAQLARRLGVRLHTHVAETLDEERYCQEMYGRRPVEYLDELEWLGEDVWLAHCVHLSPGDVGALASSGSGVAWCPTSNLRLGSGIAPVRALLDAGARVGLGVDGSASNDGGDLLAEARIGMLSQRTAGPAALSAREALRAATRGGAACLGRDDIGAIAPGRRADVALFGVEGLPFAGAEADLVGAVVFCPAQRVRHLFVEGRQVVDHGRLVGADEDTIAAAGRRLAGRIMDRSSRRIAT